MCYHDELPPPSNTSKVTIWTKPTHRRQLSIKITLFTMQITQSIFDTKARLSLVNMNLIFQPWQHLIKRGSLLKISIATEQTLHVEGKILLHVRLGSFCVGVRLGVVPNLAVDMFLGTPFIGRSTRRIFLSERKFVLWISLLVDNLPTRQHWKPTTS